MTFLKNQNFSRIGILVLCLGNCRFLSLSGLVWNSSFEILSISRLVFWFYLLVSLFFCHIQSVLKIFTKIVVFCTDGVRQVENMFMNTCFLLEGNSNWMCMWELHLCILIFYKQINFVTLSEYLYIMYKHWHMHVNLIKNIRNIYYVYIYIYI